LTNPGVTIFFFVMIQLVLFTVLVWLPREPPEFPSLPKGYSEWERNEADFVRISDLLPTMASEETRKRVPIRDTSLLPFCFSPPPDFGSWKGHFYGDSLFGEISYYNRTEVPFPYTITILWGVSNAVNADLLERAKLPDLSWAYMAYESEDWEEVKLAHGGLKALRIRGWIWERGCDGAYHLVEPFTNYFISTDGLDFYVRWRAPIYRYEGGPMPCDGPEEICDSILKRHYGEEGWKPVKHYPDRSREFELAVEQGFRVKE